MIPFILIRLGHLLRVGCLLFSYLLFRPGHLFSTGRLFFLMQSSGQDAYLGTPFIRYRRVNIVEVFHSNFSSTFLELYFL